MRCCGVARGAVEADEDEDEDEDVDGVRWLDRVGAARSSPLTITPNSKRNEWAKVGSSSIFRN